MRMKKEGGHMSSNTEITYNDIIKIEPRVDAIINAIKPAHHLQERHRQYVQAKNAVTGLVGWSASNSAIGTDSAYYCVIREICRKLNLE